ncbi:hypothetical protein Bra3105_06565 [Brachybacterium halotolerans subsp. kimchii]|uniref:hypothetical protein n=1 Tax=Brachybacterium halotolerans TaxID=2795215 RepID=UPI001E398381|nr:hypothetical protein [Brachybacterium halotolerans]UEJ83969.1 hypothetical protein Bra3105_06565 [Brachybacterium halotolerans subsp. kimchii]
MPLPETRTYADIGALAPEPPDFDITRAYYDGPAGTPCPVCSTPKPSHEPGCSEAPEGEPSYRYTPTRWNEEHPW